MSREFQIRRQRLAKSLPKKSVLILDSRPEYYRQADIQYPYRQDSNFYYLSGIEQANTLLLLFPSGRSVVFSQDKDPLKETWEGYIYSSKEIKKKFLIDEVYPLSEMDKNLKKLLKGKKKFYYDKLNPFFRKKLSPFKVSRESAKEQIRPFRRIKDKKEISHIKTAIATSIHAHKQVAKALKPGVNERALHGVFLKSIMEKGSQREAYESIVACGDNANVLHYRENNSTCKKGELLLLDAGAEQNYYSSDITRVYPVSGKFTKNQKNLYEALLKLQKSLIGEVRPGASLKKINQSMFEGISKILLDFGLLKGSLKENLKKKSFRKYCPHSVGHLLGLDVHDVAFPKKEKPLLKAHMVLTIEPGIYISKKDKKAPKDLRGLGLRIEDDILVTSKGQVNLTKALTKEVGEIEKLCS